MSIFGRPKNSYFELLVFNLPIKKKEKKVVLIE